MKKLFAITGLFALFAFVAPAVLKTNEAAAQIRTTLTPHAAKDTLTNTDTAYVYLKATHTSTGDTASTTSLLDNISRSVTLSMKKVSGTPTSCRAYLQGTVTGNSWTTIDSLVVANQTTNEKTVNLRTSDGSLIYYIYRVYFLSAGTAVTVPQAILLRRSN